jgi:branched-chain amino acid transport system substrate-binding protein
MKRRTFLGSLSGLAIPTVAGASVSGDAVRIGVLNDMSGLYADFAGPGSVVAARLAVEDIGGRVLGRPVEILSADHQNRPDVGAAIARRWIDVDGVDMITDLPLSPVALAVQGIGRERNRLIVNTSAATTELTGRQCAATGMHWVADAYALSVPTARAVIGRGAGESWFFLTVDNAGGHITEREAEAAVIGAGARVLGRARHPLNTPDFANFLARAMAMRPRAIGLANAGGDMVNAVKQAHEFGVIRSGVTLVSLFANITDIRAIGLREAQGLILTEAFYWDLDDNTRAFARRFAPRHMGRMPTAYQAGVYSAVLHYLRAVQASGTDDTLTVNARMREMPVNDMFGRGGRIREDGRMVHEMYLMRVKSPAESRGEWDVYELIARIPAEEAFRPIEQTECPLVRR